MVGVLRAGDVDAAHDAALAAQAGGLEVLEFTFTTPQVCLAIERFRAKSPHVLVGAGTVMNAAQAQDAVAAGAQFLVSPHLGEDIQAAALECAVPYIPGVLTPTEIVRARSLGVQTVKVFPAGSAGGAPYIKDLLGPFPDLHIMATGGITPAEVKRYLQAGALAVGLGSNLFPAQALGDRDWAGVRAATEAALQEIR